VPLALLIMGALGYLLDITMLRGCSARTRFAIVILTIALGFVIRFVAGRHLGARAAVLHSPLALGDVRFGGVVLSLADIAVIVVTVILTMLLWQFFQRTKLGLAMQAASQNQMAAYYMGIPVKRVQGAVWALAAWSPASPAFSTPRRGRSTLGRLHRHQGLRRGGDRRLRLLPGALMGGLIVGVIEPFAVALPAARLQPDRALCAADRWCWSSARTACSRRCAPRRSDPMRFHFKTSYDQDIRLFPDGWNFGGLCARCWRCCSRCRS
jgi:branched-chain amino acid transport system permease protein